MAAFVLSLLITTLTAAVAAAPLSNHVVHEKRDGLPAGWVTVGSLSRDAVLPVRIALKQSNLEKGHDFLMDVSHPSSANYGKHWTADEVVAAFAPAQDSVDAVMDWLRGSGIADHSITRSANKGWVSFNATVHEAESLLKTTYNLYRYQTGPVQVACQEYSVPEHMQKHIDFITPTVHFDAKIRSSKPVTEPRDRTKRTTDTQLARPPVETGVARKVGQPGFGLIPKLNDKAGKPTGTFSSQADVSNCDQEITVYCLHALYNFTFGQYNNSANSYGIVEYTPQAYVASDLDMFFNEYLPGHAGLRPILDSIDGGVVQTQEQSFNDNGESDLDLQYGMALVYPQVVTLYQVGDMVEGASFNNFLDGVDGSYCTYEGGDDPSQDATYPDTSRQSGAYKGAEDCGKYSPTKVISTSYAYNEADLTAAYEER
jgi:tripeptidyl-peptidase-1